VPLKLSQLQVAKGGWGPAAQKAALPGDKAAVNLLSLALAGKKALSQGGFDKVIKMIDEMVDVLKKEQEDDEHKKEYCATQFDFSDDKKKALERTISQEENAVASAKDAIMFPKVEFTTNFILDACPTVSPQKFCPLDMVSMAGFTV